MNKKGISAIIVVLIISAISFVMVASISFLTLDNVEILNNYIAEKKSLYLVDTCLENTLWEIEKDKTLLLNDYSLSLFDGLCIIDVGDYLDGKLINIEANKDSYYKNITAYYDLDNHILDLKYE